MQVAGIPTELEQRLEALNHLMPDMGQADTQEGEIIRATNKILHRFYNDGDKWFQGYGCETAGPAAAFLSNSPANVNYELKISEFKNNQDYEKALIQLLEKVVNYVESKNGNYSPNSIDMLDCEPKYNEDENDDDDDEYYDRYSY